MSLVLSVADALFILTGFPVIPADKGARQMGECLSAMPMHLVQRRAVRTYVG